MTDDSRDVLLTLCEVSVAFAGFSGLITAFLSRRESAWREVEKLRFWQVLTYSLTALLFSLLPVFLDWAGLASTALWRVSSAALALGILFVGTSFFRWANRLPDAERALFSRPLVLFTAIGLVGSVAVTALNAAHVGFSGGRAPYLAALLWMLYMAGLNFVRLLQSVSPAPPE